MAQVQHRLDGIEQRVALGTELVSQCPVGTEQMTRQRAAAHEGPRADMVKRFTQSGTLSDTSSGILKDALAAFHPQGVSLHVEGLVVSGDVAVTSVKWTR